MAQTCGSFEEHLSVTPTMTMVLTLILLTLVSAHTLETKLRKTLCALPETTRWSLLNTDHTGTIEEAKAEPMAAHHSGPTWGAKAATQPQHASLTTSHLSPMLM